MYLPDVNVWLALVFPSHAHHLPAREWFRGLPLDRTCHFCRSTQASFLRLANSPRGFPESAVTQFQAWELYDLILSQDRVSYSVEPPEMETIWRQFTHTARYSPSVWTDAYLAAFALACDFEVVTFDRGFAQYKELRCTILT